MFDSQKNLLQVFKTIQKHVCVESKTPEVQLHKSLLKTTTATNETTAILCEGKRQAGLDVRTGLPSETHFTAQHSPLSRCGTALTTAPFPFLTSQPTVPAAAPLLGRMELLTCSPSQELPSHLVSPAQLAPCSGLIRSLFSHSSHSSESQQMSPSSLRCTPKSWRAGEG